MEKQETLNNLYALRAGLSVISQKYDEAEAIENDCAEKLTKNAETLDSSFECFEEYSNFNDFNKFNELGKLRKRYGYIKDYTKKIESGEIQPDETVNSTHSWATNINANNLKAKKAYSHWLACDESTEFFENNLKDKQNKRDSVAEGWYDDHWAKYKQNVKKNIILSVLFFILAVVALIPPIAFIAFINADTGVTIFFSLFPVVFLILGIVFACCAKSNKSAHLREVNKEVDKIHTAEQMLEKLPQVRTQAISILKQKDEKIAPIKESCNDFYMALKKQFSPILDERDWKNLDLVIYELETQRADSVKEALQLVDRELQTERIQQTIALATEQICYEIRRGFAELKETLVECSRVISAQLSVISLQLGEMSGQLSELCDSVNMSNALQAKANETSSQLLNDVHAIRYYQ